MELSRT